MSSSSKSKSHTTRSHFESSLSKSTVHMDRESKPAMEGCLECKMRLKGYDNLMKCFLCNQLLNGQEQYEDHLKGYKHQKTLRKQRKREQESQGTDEKEAQGTPIEAKD